MLVALPSRIEFHGSLPCRSRAAWHVTYGQTKLSAGFESAWKAMELRRKCRLDVHIPAQRLLNSLRPSICVHVTTRGRLNVFSWNWIGLLESFTKIYQNTSVFIKIGQQWRTLYMNTYMYACMPKRLGGGDPGYPGYRELLAYYLYWLKLEGTYNFG
jgi:hypothetical protein